MSRKIENKDISTTETTSQLDNFQLSFEYNKTLSEIRSEVRMHSV